MTRRTGYSRFQIGLHWLIAVLVLLAWLGADDMDKALRWRIDSGATGIEGNTPHVWIGGAVFALVVLRILVRLIAGAPEPDAALTGPHRQAAIWGHRLLYLLMLAVPMAGASAWYPGIRDMGDVHETLVTLFLVTVLGHSLAAIFHQLHAGHTLMRMFRADR